MLTDCKIEENHVKKDPKANEVNCPEQAQTRSGNYTPIAGGAADSKPTSGASLGVIKDPLGQCPWACPFGFWEVSVSHGAGPVTLYSSCWTLHFRPQIDCKVSRSKRFPTDRTR